MSSDHNSHADRTSRSAPGTLFYGNLTKKQPMSLPGHFSLVSNIAWSPWVPALEAGVTEKTSRQELWRLLVGSRLDGRTVRILRDRESLQAEKEEWLKAALSSGFIE